MHSIPNKPNFIHNSPSSNLLVCCRGGSAGEYLIWFILLRYVYPKEMLIFFFAFLYFYIRNIVTFSCSFFSLSLLLIPFLSPRPGYVKEFHSISCLSVSSISLSLPPRPAFICPATPPFHSRPLLKPRNLVEYTQNCLPTPLHSLPPTSRNSSSRGDVMRRLHVELRWLRICESE